MPWPWISFGTKVRKTKLSWRRCKSKLYKTISNIYVLFNLRKQLISFFKGYHIFIEDLYWKALNWHIVWSTLSLKEKHLSKSTLSQVPLIPQRFSRQFFFFFLVDTWVFGQKWGKIRKENCNNHPPPPPLPFLRGTVNGRVIISWQGRWGEGVEARRILALIRRTFTDPPPSFYYFELISS